MTIVSYLWVVLHFCCCFSYPCLFELHKGGRLRKTQTTREWAREMGLLVREAEQRIDAELFLSEYPRWELGAPHWSIILHEMFLHAAKWGQKEVERLICQGSISSPDLEADQSAMELMGYWTSHKEIQDIYHSVYLLRRSPGLPTLWVSAEMESNPRHPLLPKKLVALAGVSCHSQRGTWAYGQLSV